MFLSKALFLVLIIAVVSSVSADEEKEKSVDKPKKQEDAGEPLAKHTTFLREYGDRDAKTNDKGYHRTSEDQGDDGYKHFDSFHKKNSDKYGYESHSAFGKSKKSKNRGSASNAKYDDKEPHEASASRRVFHILSPWSSGTSLPHITGFDIEDLARKFDRRRYHKHRIYDTTDHDFHHHHEFYHDHHPHHIEDAEYDHPPLPGGHKHDKEYGHPPVDHHSFLHETTSHHDIPEELDHLPPDYGHDDRRHEKPPPDHDDAKELDHPPPGYEHEDSHHEKPSPDHDDTKELDHPPPGYGHEDNHHEKPPPDHNDAEELDHPPPGYEHEDSYHEKPPPDHDDAKELDHPPPGYEHEFKHNEKPHPDHDDAKELDHPPPGYEHADKHHVDSPPDHADAKELDHPPPGYEHADKHHVDSPPDHADAKEIDQLPPGYQDDDKYHEKPPPGHDAAKELDHPGHGFEADSQNNVPASIHQADDRKFNLQPKAFGMDDKKQSQPPILSTTNLPNMAENGKNNLVSMNLTELPAFHQLSVDKESHPVAQNEVNNPEFTLTQPFSNNQNVTEFKQLTPDILPDSKVEGLSSPSNVSSQVSPPNTNITEPGNANEFENSQFKSTTSDDNIPSNQGYLPPPVGANNNYRIFFGGLTSYDYPKPYYDVDHWNKTLQDILSNTSSTSRTSEIVTGSNATEQKDVNNNFADGPLSKDTQSNDKGTLRDSYGNRYIPIDLKKYLPPLPSVQNSTSAAGANSGNIGGNDGIFYGEHYIPEEYFGGKFEQDETSQSHGDSEKSSDDFNDGKIHGEVEKNTLSNENMGKGVGSDDGLYFGGPFNPYRNTSTTAGGTIRSSFDHDKGKSATGPSIKTMAGSSFMGFNPIKQNYYLPPYEINKMLLGSPKSTVKTNAALQGFNDVGEKSGSEVGGSVKEAVAVGSVSGDKESHNLGAGS